MANDLGRTAETQTLHGGGSLDGDTESQPSHPERGVYYLAEWGTNPERRILPTGPGRRTTDAERGQSVSGEEHCPGNPRKSARKRDATGLGVDGRHSIPMYCPSPLGGNPVDKPPDSIRWFSTLKHILTHDWRPKETMGGGERRRGGGTWLAALGALPGQYRTRSSGPPASLRKAGRPQGGGGGKGAGGGGGGSGEGSEPPHCGKRPPCPPPEWFDPSAPPPGRSSGRIRGTPRRPLIGGNRAGAHTQGRGPGERPAGEEGGRSRGERMEGRERIVRGGGGGLRSAELLMLRSGTDS